MQELKNPKMVNEISFESLRGPITPRRANGRVISLISPRRKSGNFFCVHSASSCRIEQQEAFHIGRQNLFSIIFQHLIHLMVKTQTGYFILSNCIFVYAEVCFCIR